MREPAFVECHVCAMPEHVHDDEALPPGWEWRSFVDREPDPDDEFDDGNARELPVCRRCAEEFQQ